MMYSAIVPLFTCATDYELDVAINRLKKLDATLVSMLSYFCELLMRSAAKRDVFALSYTGKIANYYGDVSLYCYRWLTGGLV